MANGLMDLIGGGQFNRASGLLGTPQVPGVSALNALATAQAQRQRQPQSFLGRIGSTAGAMGSNLLTGPGASERLQALGASLLTGPSATPISFGQSLSTGLLAGQQLAREAEERKRLGAISDLEARKLEAEIQELSTPKAPDAIKLAELDVKQAKEAREQAKFEAEQLKQIKEEKILSEKEQAGLVSGQVATGNVLTAIQDAQSIIAESPMLSTGIGGQVLSAVGGTEAMSLDTYLDTIKANLGFDALKKMRFESPTGGALGQVSDTENRLLQATVASLQVGLGADVLNENLEKVKRHYGAVAYGVKDKDGNLRRIKTTEDVDKLFSSEYEVAYPEVFNQVSKPVITRDMLPRG